MNNNIIKATRTAVKFAEYLEVDGYMLPDGEFRYSLAGSSLLLGFSSSWLSRILSKECNQLTTLIDMGFTAKIITVRLDIERGQTKVLTISRSDLDILIKFAASKGKPEAIKLLTNNPSLISKQKNQIKKRDEKYIQLRLAESIPNSDMEVCTPAGKIDILSSSELIEVKEWKSWKEAVGQVICYGDYYPSHQKRIHFFGKAHSEFIELVTKHCHKHSILVTWE